jgi:hypothetical protein
LRPFRELNGKGPLEGTFCLLKLQDGIKDLPQMVGTAHILLLFHGDLYPPVLGPPHLQDILARFFVDAPHLALREDGLEGRAAAQKGDRPGGAVYSERPCHTK